MTDSNATPSQGPSMFPGSLSWPTFGSSCSKVVSLSICHEPTDIFVSENDERQAHVGIEQVRFKMCSFCVFQAASHSTIVEFPADRLRNENIGQHRRNERAAQISQATFLEPPFPSHCSPSKTHDGRRKLLEKKSVAHMAHQQVHPSCVHLLLWPP
jgi:hypothetical protein